MNIMFFLTPKSETVYVTKDSVIQKVLNEMDVHGLSAIPVIDEEGRYFGTVTKGDILRLFTEEPALSYEQICQQPVEQVTGKERHESVRVDEPFSSLVHMAMSQNYVPVVDDQGVYSGIIKRSDIIEYLYKSMINKSARTL